MLLTLDGGLTSTVANCKLHQLWQPSLDRRDYAEYQIVHLILGDIVQTVQNEQFMQYQLIYTDHSITASTSQPGHISIRLSHTPFIHSLYGKPTQSNPMGYHTHSTEGERGGEASLVLSILLVTTVGALQEVPVEKDISIHSSFHPNPSCIALPRIQCTQINKNILDKVLLILGRSSNRRALLGLLGGATTASREEDTTANSAHGSHGELQQLASTFLPSLEKKGARQHTTWEPTFRPKIS